jgi:hypothetical protein
VPGECIARGSPLQEEFPLHVRNDFPRQHCRIEPARPYNRLPPNKPASLRFWRALAPSSISDFNRQRDVARPLIDT